MAERLVTIATFSTPIEAHLARAKLEASGIEATVAGEMAAGTAGGVDLQVGESSAENALAILRGDTRAVPPRPPPAGSAQETERCLVCQSSLVSTREGPLVMRVLGAILLQLFPVPEEWLRSRRRKCGVCGHEWEET